jgi:hypothetical protein
VSVRVTFDYSDRAGGVDQFSLRIGGNHLVSLLDLAARSNLPLAKELERLIEAGLGEA